MIVRVSGSASPQAPRAKAAMVMPTASFPRILSGSLSSVGSPGNGLGNESFLRRHYPDQVLTVGGTYPPSQPGLAELPCLLFGQ